MDPTGDLARPWGERLRTWREEIKGWSREELAEYMEAAGYELKEVRQVKTSAKQIARWETGQTKQPQWMHRRALAHLGAPLPTPPARTAPVMSPECPGESKENVDDGGVDRRNFLRTSGTVAAATTGAALTEPWERLSNALAGTNKLDGETAATIEQQTLSLFDLEERAPAHQVVREANSHLDQISALLSVPGSSGFQEQLVSQAGASAALAGWLAFDQGSFDVASKYYDVAENAARQADDLPLTACVRAYRSYLADARGAFQSGARHLQDALDVLPYGQEHKMKAWLSARQAETAVVLGNREDALRAFERAYMAQESSGSGQPMWTRFFTPARLDGMAVAGYARLNHPDMESAGNSLLTGIGTGETKVEQIALADLAYAYLERGDVERGAEYGQQALDAINRSETRVGYDRLTVITKALTPYRDSRAATGLRDQLAETLRL